MYPRLAGSSQAGAQLEKTKIIFLKFNFSYLSSLRLHRALRCLGGDMKDGFGGLGRGMSSALVGSGYGWGGWVVCFVGGVFSWGGWLGGCGVCVCVACDE